MNLKRITRLLALLRSLQSGERPGVEELARACGVSRRTVFRDLETLRTAGVPLELDRAAGAYSLGGSFLPPTELTPDEAAAIVVLAKFIGAEVQLPLLRAARTAAQKLQLSMPAAVRKDIQRRANAIHLRPSATNHSNGDGAIHEHLVEAIASRRVVRVAYASLTEWETIETKLRPYHLVMNRHTWYVIGRSSLHREPRTFNVSRIRSLALTDERFSMPRGFSVDRYFGNAWNIMPQAGADLSVHVRFSPLVAYNVAEIRWHKSQRLHMRDDGSLDFHVRVSGLNEIVWWILGYGDQAEVLKPSRLRRLVAQRAKNMHQIYES